MKIKIFNLLLCLSILFLWSDGYSQIHISGVVMNSDGETLPGVSVQQKGTNNGTITDNHGKYEITLGSDGKKDTLVFSFIGFSELFIPVKGEKIIDASLTNSAMNLDEIVFTGYMSQKRSNIIGAVTSVSGDDIQKTHGSTNVLTALQGVVPGMRVLTDGSPTASRTNVNIRGLTSVNGAPPLVVIDGQPMPGLNLRDINSNNISSIQILKDAYSASIYGAQGAGGVILIETKQGKKGEVTVTYNSMAGFSDWFFRPKLLNTVQYGAALWQAAVNDGVDPANATRIYKYDWHEENGIPILDKVNPVEDLGNGMIAANTDWINESSHKGLQMDHQLTISGGTDRFKSMFSIDYYKNDGFIKHTGYERISARLNTSYSLLKDKVQIGENLEISRLNMSNVNDRSGIHMIMVEPSIVPVYSTTGEWGGSAQGLGMDDYQNPVRIFEQNKDNRDKFNKVIGNVYINIQPIKDLNIRSQAGLVYTSGDHRTINFKFHEAGGRSNNVNSVDQWYMWNASQVWTNTADYKLNFGKNEIEALIGMEASKLATETTQGNRQDLEFENYNFAYLSTATGNATVTGFGDRTRTLSYFGKLNYIYNGKYLVSGSLRRDGSSKFGINNRFGTFPAFSIGWKMNEEEFMKSNNIFTELKPRISWGMNGNSNIPTGATTTQFISDYNFTSYAILGAETGINPSGFYKSLTGNEFIKWETSKQWDYGVDFGILGNKLYGTFDYYVKKTNGMLFNPPYLGAIGEGGSMWVNAADMQDKGFEFSLTYQGFVNQDFHWGVTGNLSHNRNEITNLPPSVRFSYGGSVFKGDDIQGRPFHSVYGFKTDGIFKSQEEVDDHASQPGKGIGRIRYMDVTGPDGKPDGKVDFDYDQVWLGSSDPKIEYGIAFNASYKNFDFYMLWQGISGLMVFDQTKTYSDFWNVWVQQGFNHPVRILDAWSPTNSDSNIPALSLVDNNNELRMSDYLLSSGSYLKLRNIQLGYSIPNKLINSIGINKLRIYILAENLALLKKRGGKNAFVGPDPETANVENPNENYLNPYVIPTNVKFGLEITFK